MIGHEIQDLIRFLSKLPGLGPRSGRRVALHLLKKPNERLKTFIDILEHARETIRLCSECGSLDSTDPCSICLNSKRDITTICVVEDVSDLWAIERSSSFNGVYHVLGGQLSALDGIGPEDLNIQNLIKRTLNLEVKEVILALNPNLQGQTTAFYLQDILKRDNLTITALANGVPLGGELDYLDSGTLTAALTSRRAF